MEVQILSPRLGDSRRAQDCYVEKDGYKRVSEPATWSGKIFAMFVVFGIASLTPWNMFITATAYFESKFKGSGQAIEQNFQNYFQTGAICTDVLMSFITVPLVRMVRIPRLVYFALSVMLAMFLLTSFLAHVDSSTWARDFFLLTEVSFCIMCGGGAMFISTMLAITSSLHPLYIDAFLIGLTLAGVIASVLNIITLSIPDIDFVGAGFWYFVGASAILTISIILFGIFHCRHYQDDYTKVRASPESDSSESDSTEIRTPFSELVRKTAPHGYSCFFGLYITFVMFPAVLSSLKSSSDNTESVWANRYFLPVALFLSFNMGDLLGRFVARMSEFPGRCFLPWYTTLRAVFVLLLLMCNLHPRVIPVWFSYDLIPATLTFFFACAGGQILTLSLRFGAEKGTTTADKATIGTIMGAHGALGRILGSLSTYIIFMIIR